MCSVGVRVVCLILLTTCCTLSMSDNCPDNWFKCGNSRCISEIWVCDGENDCGDLTDEENCEDRYPPARCLSSQFECLSDQHCIPEKWHCDGEADCADESDEKNCNNSTQECGGFRCRNNQCIPTRWHCDGLKDCTDGSDEENCPTDKLCTEKEFLCSTGSCVNKSVVCDGKKDCSDGSDEGSHCGDACSNTTCSQKCRISPAGPQCYCEDGFLLDKDNKTCIDINECLVDGFCSHGCVNTKGSFKCSCWEGYELVNKSCKAAGADPLLLFSTLNEIRGMSLRSNRYFLVRRATGKSTAVDADPANQRVYWVEISNKSTIYSAKVDGTGFRTILSHGLLLPEDIAVDHVANNLYLTDAGLKQVLVCKMDGTMCHVLHDKNIEKPRSLVLDPAEGWMYWSDWGESAAGIYKSGMDGSLRRTFVSRNVAWPNGIAIDHTTNRLYWADAKLKTIEYITLDGSTRKVILNATVFHPYSLAVFEDTIYWTDWGTFSLEACNKFTGHKMTLLARENGRHIMGVHVYHPVLYSGVTNPCWSNTCSHMCLIAPSRKFQCACPPGFALAADGHTCARKEERTQLVFVTEGSSVYIIRPEAVGSEIIVELPLNLPTELISRVAYDSESKLLFAADLSTPAIIDINMTSLHKRDLVKNHHIEAPVDLAFDRMSNNLYWVDAARGTVEVISIRDLHRARIIDGLKSPVALAISPERGLLFVASEADSNTQFPVFVYDIDGKNGRPLKSVQGHPMSLALHPSKTLLYWTDPMAGSISYTNYSISSTPRVLKSRLNGVLSVDASEEYVYWVTRRNELGFLKGNLTHALSLPGPVKEIAIRRVTYSSGRTIGKSACWIGNGGCNFLCLTSPKGTSCACQSGMTLDASNKTCIAITTCGNDEFKCKRNGRCIPLEFKCDGSRDCDDGSDEMGCTNHHHKSIRCSGADFQCRNGRCILQSWVCDRRNDCHDNSDEENCPETTACAKDQFTCGDGDCITNLWRCDGEPDCADSTDEAGCNVTRCDPASQFRCNNGQCIPISWPCDGTSDCVDESDEQNCTKSQKCSSSEFRCDGDGICLDEFLKCDGRRDCKDGSDEKDCPITSTACKKGMFRCNDGACIYDYEMCDGHRDCSGGEEELNCSAAQCQLGSVQCPKLQRCILRKYICDGDDDCLDGSDESNCTTSTPAPRKVNQAVLAAECNEFFCYADDQCLPWSKVCDGYQDCEYVPDEGRQCSRACLKDNGGCTQICNKSPEGSKCECQSGYRLLADGKTCDDINECLDPGSCSHYCNNTKGSFKCSCAEGYFLHDHSLCKIIGGQGNLVLLLGDQIRAINLHSRAQKVILSVKNADMRGMDYDAVDGVYYYTEYIDDSINAYSPETHRQDVLIRRDSRPVLIKYDWLSKNIYFTDDDGNIGVVSKDGKYTSILLNTGSIHVDSMAISPTAGLMFWTIWASAQGYYASGLIERAEMDGSHRMPLITDKTIYPNAISVDHVLNRIYWADYKLNIIECADFNGFFRKQIVEKDVYFPNSITLFEDHVYWADWGTNSILRCNKFGKNDCSKFQEGGVKPREIEAVHMLLQFKGTSRCLNSGCPHLCLPTRSSFVCKCSEEYVQRNNTCELSPATSPSRVEDDRKECPKDYCLSGGTCRVENGEFICSCPEQYYGPYCEEKVSVAEPKYGYSWIVFLLLAGCIILGIVLIVLVCCRNREKIRRLSENVSVKFRNPKFGRGGRLVVDTDDGSACDELVLGQEGEYRQSSFGNPLFGKKPYTIADTTDGEFKRWPSYDSEDSAFISENQSREGSQLCSKDTAPALGMKNKFVQFFERS